MKLNTGEQTLKSEEFKDLQMILTLTNERLVMEKRTGLFKTWKINKEVNLKGVGQYHLNPIDSRTGAVNIVFKLTDNSIITVGPISHNNHLDEEITDLDELTKQAKRVASDNSRIIDWRIALNNAVNLSDKVI